jgi:hypothetical protein
MRETKSKGSIIQMINEVFDEIATDRAEREGNSSFHSFSKS